MTFKELYLSGQVPFEEIDRYISRWNRSDDERTLAKYLGLNADEEDVWIDDSDEALKEMLDARERVAGTPVTLGKTDIIVNKNGFGALPIQRISFDDAKVLLRKAYDAGVRFFDTARFYTDSEEKIGYALSDVREHIYIATKTAATTAEGFWKDLETSLHNLKTDYVDIYQFHNPAVCPKPGDGSGLYEAMLEAKEQGKIRFIGITNHRMSIAEEAIESGLYDTLQFPFNYLSTEREIALAKACAPHDDGRLPPHSLSRCLCLYCVLIFPGTDRISIHHLRRSHPGRIHPGLYPAGLPIRGCPSDYLCQFPPRYRRCDLHGCHLLYRLLPDRHARMLHLRLCTRVGHHRNLDRLSDRAYPDRSHALREVLLETKN